MYDLIAAITLFAFIGVLIALITGMIIDISRPDHFQYPAGPPGPQGPQGIQGPEGPCHCPGKCQVADR